jgi:hypothetical protein
MPVVNVCNNCMRTSLAMFVHKILIDPHHNMIFEGSFDDLMKQVRR